MSFVDIIYSTTQDYSYQNKPQFVPVLNLYNTVLIPRIEQFNKLFNITVSDKLLFKDTINNRQLIQSVVLDKGNIKLNNIEYLYFYIGNGIRGNSEYILEYESEIYHLSHSFSNLHDIKLLNGLLVLDDNFSYMFNDQLSSIVRINEENLSCAIKKVDNRFSYYKLNTNNTLLYILDNSNLNLLYAINQPYINNILIRPLYNSKFPLGSARIKIIDSNGVTNNEPKYKIFLSSQNNNDSLFVNDVLNIKNLSSGSYTIKIIDKNGPVLIRNINGIESNLDSFVIDILPVKDSYSNIQHKLPKPHYKKQPDQGLANIMINLPYNENFEIFGPNNYYKNFNNGHQALYNMKDGLYTIKTQNTSKQFEIFKNNNNYISDLA